MGLNDLSETEWYALMVSGSENEESLRFCLDCRKLNAATVRYSYITPKMDHSIGSLRNALIVSTLDANGSFWQVEIEDNDSDKKDYTLSHGRFRFSKKSFRLHNAPGMCQKTMKVLPSLIKWQFTLVYTDDTVMFFPNAVEHISHVRTVLALLHKAGVTLNLKKCNFFTKKNEYLGPVIRQGKLELTD